MCGICGKITKSSIPINDELENLISGLAHRGPDGQGSYVDKGVNLGMRRLSIIDLAGGSQPLYNEDRTIVVMGNGEIYNYLELQKELKKSGHRLRTGSDIETIAHLYEDYGIEGVKYLRGMFAIALYDKKKQKVILARDRLGEKPLYWTRIGNSVVFSSEMKVLIKAKGFRKKINKQAVNKFFNFFYIPEPETMFEGVAKLGPGQILEIDLKKWKTTTLTYWDAKEIEVSNDRKPEKEIRNTLEESCRLTLRSDVPVGISLSGGIDSGAILALSAPFYKDKMKAFSIGYEGRPASDERKMAKRLAKKFNVEFIEKEITTEEVVEHFPNLVWDMDDPIADIAGHSIYCVNKLARDNGIKVLLGGLGGDELFWGYPWMAQAVKNSIAKLEQNKTPLGKLRNLLLPENQMIMTFYQTNPGFKLTKDFTSRFFSKRFRSEINNGELFEYMKLSSTDELSIAKKGMDLIRDVWLVSNCIDLGDRLSMSASVELRSPFLDYRLVEMVLSNRNLVMAYQKPQKYWLKRALKGVLPNEVLNREKKGFTPPVGEWIREILKKYVYLLQDGFLTDQEVLNKRKASLLVNTWIGLPMYWYSIYQLVLLELWGRMYVYNYKPSDFK